jgi:hypothetical protein
MHPARKRADEQRMMAHTPTSTAPDQLDHLLARAVGRFGRPARMIAVTDPETAPPRGTTVSRMRDRLNGSQYRIDSSLVATAIVDRVCDVGLISRLH